MKHEHILNRIKPSAYSISLLLLIGLLLIISTWLSPLTAHAQDATPVAPWVGATYLPTAEPTPTPTTQAGSKDNSSTAGGFVWPNMDTNTLLSILVTLAAAWLTLPGVRGVIVAVVNIGKSIGLVRDGTAPRWFAALNLILFISVGLLIVFGPLKTEALDSQLGMLATILTLLGVFVSQIVQAPDTSDAVKALQLPGVSTSFSPPPTTK